MLWAVAQEGKPYVMGAEADAADPDPPKFDCSELVQWAAARAGGEIADGAFWQYETCRKAGTLIPVPQGIDTRGALLFRATTGRPARFDDVPHVAISAGDGLTVEARGRAWGVGAWGAAGRFQFAGLIPGFDYSPRVPLPAGPPPPAPDRLHSGEWHAKNAAADGPADVTFRYGDPGDRPIVGDWNGKGTDGPGVVRGTAWLLRHDLTGGFADLAFTYGDLGDVPIVGDWDGDGIAGVGVVRGTRFLLRDTLSAGFAEHDFTFGDPGDVPIVGHWHSGDRRDSIGVRRGATVYLRNPDTGAADIVYGYGDPGDRMVMGDWDGDGIDTPVVVRAGRWHVRHSNTDGPADLEFGFGDATDIPLAGRWLHGANRDGVAVAR